MRLQSYINEVLDKPAKYTLRRIDEYQWDANFYIDNYAMNWSAWHKNDEDTNEDTWEILFETEGKEDILNIGIPFALKTFATIKDITSKWLKKVNPQNFYFTSKIKEPSRVKLYDKFAKEISKTEYKLANKFKSSGRYSVGEVKYVFKRK